MNFGNISVPSELRINKAAMLKEDAMGKKKYKHADIRGNVVQVRGTIDGQRQRLSTDKPGTAANLKWVDANWREVIKDLLDKTTAVVQKAREDGLLLKYYGQASLEANESSRRLLTNREYENIFKQRIIPTFGDMRLDEIKVTAIKKWQSEMLKSGLSPNRVHNIRTVFFGILKDAESDGLIDENPFAKVDGIAKRRTEIHPFTLEEVKVILNEADGWFKNLLTLAFFSGMRTGEMLALTWDDINFVSNKININKSIRHGISGDPKTVSSIREIDMLPVVQKALREQYALTGLKSKTVFETRFGRGFSCASGVTQIHWHPLIKRCLLSKRDFYHTRHSFATMMIGAGEDILWVASMLGHADASITLKFYAKYRPNNAVQRASFLENEFDESSATGTRFGTKLAQAINSANLVQEIKVG